MTFVPNNWNKGCADGQECERLCIDCGSPSIKSQWLHGLKSRIARETDAPSGGFTVRRLRFEPAADHIGISCQNWSGSSIGCEIVETRTGGCLPGWHALIAVNGTTVLSATPTLDTAVRLKPCLLHDHDGR